MTQSKPADEQVMGKVEPVERKEEVKVAPLPPRRASTSTPSNMSFRLLTRLGSLDGEPTPERRHVINFTCSVKPRLLLTTPLSLISHPGAPAVPMKKSPATLPRNFTLPKEPHGSLLRARMSTPTGSPHLGPLHPQLPPSCIIEELHRALATKHRQDRSVKDSRISVFSLVLT